MAVKEKGKDIATPSSSKRKASSSAAASKRRRSGVLQFVDDAAYVAEDDEEEEEEEEEDDLVSDEDYDELLEGSWIWTLALYFPLFDKLGYFPLSSCYLYWRLHQTLLILL